METFNDLEKLNQLSATDLLGSKYSEHGVFAQLSEYSQFYGSLSNTTMNFSTGGTKAILNLDTYLFTSVKGTLESINDILQNGRINDAYALLRKYYDSTIINVYTNLYLEENYNLESLIVDHVEDWRTGKKTIPEFRIMSRYIMNSDKLKPITDLLQQDKLYKEVRLRCNDHTHYNYYYNLVLNDNEVQLTCRVKVLGLFSKDLSAVFLQHFACLFYLKERYLSSTDYIDALDLDMIPVENSQYWVAPFIQDAFNKWIKPLRPDIAEELQKNTCMELF